MQFDRLKARFTHEACVTGALEHPGIAPVYEVGATPEGVPYYTMRYIRGGRTLQAELEEMAIQPLARRLSLIEVLLKTADSLAYAHSRGVVHRDVKPANIALGSFGEVVMLDWGLALVRGTGAQPDNTQFPERLDKRRRDLGLDTGQSAMGTAGYMSPEAARGETSTLDARTDVFALGVILFQILTGRMPFPTGSLSTYLAALNGEGRPQARFTDPNVPQLLDQLCTAALSREATARPADAGEFAMALRRWRDLSIVQGEIEALTREAEALIGAAESETGDARLRSLDRAAGIPEQLKTHGAPEPGVSSLQTRIEQLRSLGLHESTKALARSVRRRAAIGGLVLCAAIASAATLVVLEKKGEADAARDQAEVARTRADVARAQKEELLARSETMRRMRLASGLMTLQHFSRAQEELSLVPESHRDIAWHLLVDEAGERSRAPRGVVQSGSVTYDIAFSPDGRLLGVAGGKHGADIVRASDGVVLASVHMPDLPTMCVAFSPDGRRLAMGGRNGTVSVASLGGEVERSYVHGGAQIRGVAWLSDDAVVVVSQEGAVTVQTLGAKEAAKPLFRVPGNPSCAALSPDRKLVAIGTLAGTVHVRELFASGELEVGSLTGNVLSVSFSPKGDAVLGIGNRDAKLWSVSTRSLRESQVMPWLAGISGELLLDEGLAAPLVFLGSADGYVSLGIAGEGAPLRSMHLIKGSVSPITAMRRSPDGRRLAIAGGGGILHVLNAPERRR